MKTWAFTKSDGSMMSLEDVGDGYVKVEIHPSMYSADKSVKSFTLWPECIKELKHWIKDK